MADKGFAGKEFKQLTQLIGLELLRPDRKDETDRNGNLGGVRQRIESVNQTSKASSTSKCTSQRSLIAYDHEHQLHGTNRLVVSLLSCGVFGWEEATEDEYEYSCAR